MDIVIIGLPQSGKTTVFNALTRGHADVARRGAGSVQTHVGVVKVADPRLDQLAVMFHPKKVTPAEVRYIDLPEALRGFSRGAGPSGQFVAQAAQCDALLHVVRAFADPTVPHESGGVDPMRDVATLDMELIFADIALIERRLERLDTALKAAKPSEREAGQRERALWQRLRAELEREAPLRRQSLSEEAAKAVATAPLLSGKPQLLLANIGEDDIARADAIAAEVGARCGEPQRKVGVLCAKLEAELAALPDAEAAELRDAYGLGPAMLEQAVRLSHELLGMATFYTFVSDEARAWTVAAGTAAPQAAGKVHTDMERGFIRAEVVAMADLVVAAGSMAEARRRGLVRLEGRTYPVRDGDVITFFFNV